MITKSMKSVDLKATVRRMTLNLRAVNRIVQTDDFTDLWEKSHDRESVIQYIKDINIIALRNWIHDSLDLRDMSYRQLIALCQKHHVTNYSRMQKEEMVKALGEIYGRRS